MYPDPLSLCMWTCLAMFGSKCIYFIAFIAYSTAHMLYVLRYPPTRWLIVLETSRVCVCALSFAVLLLPHIMLHMWLSIEPSAHRTCSTAGPPTERPLDIATAVESATNQTIVALINNSSPMHVTSSGILKYTCIGSAYERIWFMHAM